MNEWKNRLIHLDHCRGIGWKAIFTILQNDPQLDYLYERSPQYWQKTLPIPSEKLTYFLTDLHNLNIKTIPLLHQQNSIFCTSYLDKDYPTKLLHIYQPPWLLYGKGNIDLMHDQNTLAVIGTRKPTQYGEKVLSKLIPELIEKDVSIISGLALGIDSMAQRMAVEKGGKVIAVLGSGLLNIYPNGNVPLANDIMETGLLISEYPPVTKAQPWHFPMRNRIISGLSRSILVVEGRKRSGTFITIQHGLDQGKDIFAIPGDIFSEQSIGPNELIQEGAKPVHCAQDIVSEWSDF